MRICPPIKEDFRSYFKKGKRSSGVYHYSNAIKAVRVFTRFLGREEIGKSFKFPRIDIPILIAKNKSELQKFYNEGFSNLGDRALFLVLATSGLRHHVATELTPKDVNLDTGMVIPNNEQAIIRGTKNTFVTFINSSKNGSEEIYGFSRNWCGQQNIQKRFWKVWDNVSLAYSFRKVRS